MNIIVIAVCLLLIGVLFYLPVSQYIVLDTDGNQVNGLSAIAMEKEYANTYAGKLTDEKSRPILRHIKPCLMILPMFPKTQNKRH